MQIILEKVRDILRIPHFKIHRVEYFYNGAQ